MGDKSKIAWTDATWNPTVGCRKVSAGCDHCYAIRDAHRLAGHDVLRIASVYDGLTVIQNGRLNWTGTFRELPERLLQPLRWRRPRRIFVNSMSDLFGEGISEEYVDQVFAVMALCPQHQFQVLTKRPARMRDYASEERRHEQVHRQYRDLANDHWAALPTLIQSQIANDKLGWRPHFAWPLPNVWLGVSVEDQRAAAERIPLLLRTAAAVRFLSCEPLLREVILSDVRPSRHIRYDALWGGGIDEHSPCQSIPNIDTPGVDWVIVGGESGPGARPMHPDWARTLVDECRYANVPLFVKQTGSVWASESGYRSRKGADPGEWPEWLQVREFPEEP